MRFNLLALVLAIILGPAPLLADWGLIGGFTQIKVEDTGLARFTGYGGGLLAVPANMASLVRFTYYEVENDGATATMDMLQTRVSMRLLQLSFLLPYIGGGSGLTWLERSGVRSRLWVGEVHAGVLVAPLDLFHRASSALPCFSCLKDSGSPECKRCLSSKNRANRRALQRGPAAPSWLYLGGEISYRSAKKSLSGWEGRLFGAVVF